MLLYLMIHMKSKLSDHFLKIQNISTPPMFLAFFSHDYLVKKNLLQKFSHHVNIILNGNNIIKNKNLFPLKY